MSVQQSLSPFADLLSSQEIVGLFSSSFQFEHYLSFEIALTQSIGLLGLGDQNKVMDAAEKMQAFTPDLEKIARFTLLDGLPVPGYVRQLKAHVGNELASVVHLGATSQDLIDTATALTIKTTNEILAHKIKSVIGQLEELKKVHGANVMMGRTRMQAALPIAVSQRLETWIGPLKELSSDLDSLRPKVECLQLGGPVGDRAAYGDKADAVAEEMARIVGLSNPLRPWHGERGRLADYANWLSRVTGALGKMGQDMALMAQQGIDEITFTGGGGSSAMPHKQNPVLAEILVTLARYNATQLPAMHHALVHEQERSGAAWALEWMVLPNMMSSTDAALTHAKTLAGSVTRIGTPAE